MDAVIIFPPVGSKRRIIKRKKKHNKSMADSSWEHQPYSCRPLKSTNFVVVPLQKIQKDSPGASVKLPKACRTGTTKSKETPSARQTKRNSPIFSSGYTHSSSDQNASESTHPTRTVSTYIQTGRSLLEHVMPVQTLNFTPSHRHLPHPPPQGSHLPAFPSS